MSRNVPCFNYQTQHHPLSLVCPIHVCPNDDVGDAMVDLSPLFPLLSCRVEQKHSCQVSGVAVRNIAPLGKGSGTFWEGFSKLDRKCFTQLCRVVGFPGGHVPETYGAGGAWSILDPLPDRILWDEEPWGLHDEDFGLWIEECNAAFSHFVSLSLSDLGESWRAKWHSGGGCGPESSPLSSLAPLFCSSSSPPPPPVFLLCATSEGTGRLANICYLLTDK